VNNISEIRPRFLEEASGQGYTMSKKRFHWVAPRLSESEEFCIYTRIEGSLEDSYDDLGGKYSLRRKKG